MVGFAHRAEARDPESAALTPSRPWRWDAGRPSPETLRWVEGAVGRGARVRWVRAVASGSCAVHQVRVTDRRGRWHRFALRRFVDRERLDVDPWYVPGHELVVLRTLEGSGVRAPGVVAEDLRATRCDAPALLTTWVRGAPPVLRRWADRQTRGFVELAEELALIHEVRVASGRAGGGLPPYEPYRAGSGAFAPPSWSRRRHLWERVARIASGAAPDTPAGFIHRDYHPGNTLWRRDRLTGVVDWTTGCIGPFGIDLARMRLNLAAALGADAAERFLATYEEVTGRHEDRHPYWDAVDALDFVMDAQPRTPEERRALLRFERWVEAVIAQM